MRIFHWSCSSMCSSFSFVLFEKNVLQFSISFVVAYSTDDVIYEWRFGRLNSVEIAEDMTLSQFDLLQTPCFNNTSSFRGGMFALVVTMTRRCLNTGLIKWAFIPRCLRACLTWARKLNTMTKCV